jgi:DNA invertase Pin-like site-specific DNA recombinase
MRGRIVDVGYTRVSTLDQDLTIQLTALDRAGCHPIYEEKRSGAEGKQRPVRDEVLAQLQAGDTLTVWKLDRLGRSVAEVLAIVKDLERRRITFRCLTQPIDTSSPSGKLFLTLLAAFAEFEREMILERTAAGRARRKAEGLLHGGPRMFGTVGIGPSAVSEERAEEEAELLREAAHRLVDDGDNLSQIVEDWNGRGLVPLRGEAWRVTSLRRMLLNPRAEEIVGTDYFRELARIFDNRNGQRQQLGRPADHLLSGILRCGREGCGQPLYAAHKTGKTGVPQLVYRCKKATGSGGRFAGCGSTQVSLTRADTWIEEAFIAAVVSDNFADSLAKRQAELLADDMTADLLDDMRREIEELEAVIPTRFGTPDMRRRHDDLQRQVHEATSRLMAAPELQEMLDLPRSEAALRAAWDGWSVAERRTWLRRILHHITVLPAPPHAHHRGSDVEARLDPQWKV